MISTFGFESGTSQGNIKVMELENSFNDKYEL